jgi:CheY-like chemotaxis protein
VPNGGSLIIETSNASLDDDYAAQELDVKSGQYVLIEVTDTGNGISPNVVDNIFEPFFTTKEVGIGSGLGLSMIYGFIKQSGGHIRVSSKQGEGTTFSLYLPRSHAKSAPVQIDTTAPQAIGGNETILVVEDDPLVRDYVIEQLKGLGYRTFGCPYGSDALVLLDQNPLIDLLFTDVVMPGGMGGRELANAARAQRPELKVLFTSGYTENSIDQNGRLDSDVEFLSKPYRRNQLAAKVRKVLDETH